MLNCSCCCCCCRISPKLRNYYHHFHLFFWAISWRYFQEVTTTSMPLPKALAFLPPQSRQQVIDNLPKTSILDLTTTSVNSLTERKIIFTLSYLTLLFHLYLFTPITWTGLQEKNHWKSLTLNSGQLHRGGKQGRGRKIGRKLLPSRFRLPTRQLQWKRVCVCVCVCLVVNTGGHASLRMIQFCCLLPVFVCHLFFFIFWPGFFFFSKGANHTYT